MTQNNVLPEGATRNQGANAQQVNITIAKMVAGIVKTTLGPKGMDKLLVDSLGDVTVTNDGVTILREMTIENPVAKMMVEIAKTQELEVGDGTTTAVVLAGELLSNAEELIKKKIHPTVIAKGYQIACDKGIDILKEMAIDIKKKPEYEIILNQIAMTAMTGKGAESDREHLAKVVVDAILKVAEGDKVDLDSIMVEKKTGNSVKNTQVIEGIVLDKTKIHPNMPDSVKAAKIAIIDSGIEIKNLEMDAKININSPQQMQEFMLNEANEIKGMIDQVTASGANVLICGKNVDESAQHFLTKQGIFAMQRISREDLNRISKATGAKIVTSITDLTAEDCGKAGEVSQEFIGDSDMIFIKECENPKSITIMVRGATEQVTSEVKRALEDAMGDIATMVRQPNAVGGAGAPEMKLSEALQEFSKQHKGREQLAIQAFAKAMEIIPETLAENAGLDPIDIMAELQSDMLTGTTKWPGINVFTGRVMDSWKEGVIEPLRVKTQAISSAAEVATMVLRIDDVISIMHNPDELKAQRAQM